MDVKNELKILMGEATRKIAAKLGISSVPDVVFEVPRESKFGDLSTNCAMQLARLAGSPAAEASSSLLGEFISLSAKSDIGSFIDKAELKGPGFINIFLKRSYYADGLMQIYGENESYGRDDLGKQEKVLLEFVSANPTGPLSVAHARQAAIGDSLARILDFAGYKVSREYYINDEGRQITLLGSSIRARYLELIGRPSEFPQDGYKGAYVYDMAQKVIDLDKDKYSGDTQENLDFFIRFGVEYLMSVIKKDLEEFGVEFDSWVSQKELRRSGAIEKTIDALKDEKLIYEKDGALWFYSSRFGDDKDRVVLKNDKTYTYLAPDMAYHKEKFGRGYARLINIWGPDHHGYIARLKAAVSAFGRDENALSVLIVQLASLYKGGVPVPMSTRQGEFITLREVIEEVGRDAARFFFLMRKCESHLDFDMELAKRDSKENPVYYIQYAHARIANIFGFARSKNIDVSLKDAQAGLLVSDSEIELIKFLLQFPVAINSAAANLEPYYLVLYLQELAGRFHNFYDTTRVISDNAELTHARLLLAHCTKTVFRNGLSLIGVSIPDKM